MLCEYTPVSSIPVAITGIGCVYPKASNPAAYWRNLLDGGHAFAEVPRDRWDIERYYDPRPGTADRTYSRLGAFLDNVLFDWKKYRMPPRLVSQLNPMHLALFDAVEQALTDAGPVPAQLSALTGVVIGSLGMGIAPDHALRVRTRDYLDYLSATPAVQALAPRAREEMLRVATAAIETRLAPPAEDTVLGGVTSIAVGRVMNYFGLRGPHYAVDAGYGSSLAAVDAAVRCLVDGTCDRVVVAGTSSRLHPVDLLTFSQLRALSAQHLLPFDTRADGTLFGEGVGVLVLERDEDATARGRVPHAVLRGVGAASNGGGPALFAPSKDAEVLAMRRALDDAGLEPEDVQFVECHATGTPLGDQTEVAAVREVFGGLSRGAVGLGSVKEQIGHLQAGAGMAGLIKVTLALRHGVLPPQHHFRSAAPDLMLHDGPLEVQVRAAPWRERARGRRPRACVNSFGFGGVNYSACLEAAEPPRTPAAVVSRRRPVAREPIAIIGMGGVFPGAPDVATFWRNNVEGVDTVREVPASRFAIERYLDPSRGDRTRSYTRFCTAVDDLRAPPALLQTPPASVAQLDPTQVLALRASAEALAHSGVLERGLDREQTAVIIADMPQRKREMEAVLRIGAVEYRAAVEKVLGDLPVAALDEAEARFKADFLPITEDTLVGYLGGVISGRVARRFGLRGANMAVESACASSLYALTLACQGLQQHRFSVAVAGGVCCNTSPEVFAIACAFNGLSASKIAPFDAAADGFIGGEGAGAVVLKRLADARRDGDRVLGVVRGIGTSSDGAARSVFAPDATGQALAVRRALDDAQIAPNCVDYIECHGTGTYAGDVSEVSAYAQVYGGHGRVRPIALSSVKSMVGHLNAAAGIASVVRVLCALGARQLPPTLHFRTPNPDAPFTAGPFEVVDRTIPWPETPGRPRRAGVSSFGLGGSNVHVILEEVVD